MNFISKKGFKNKQGWYPFRNNERGCANKNSTRSK